MENPLSEYQLRHSGQISKTEKVATSRRLLALSHRLSPKVADLAANTYTYLRIIDDAVDESPYVVPLRKQLKNEKDALLGKCDPTELQQCYLERVLTECGNKKESRIRACLAQIVSGSMIDLNIRYTQKPRTDQQLRIRNYLALWPDLVALSVGAFNTDLTPTSKSFNLMHAWGSYDNLSDMTEDLKCGLVLINREDLKINKLSFRLNEALPNNDLCRYYNQKRRQIIKSLRQNASAILGVRLPPIVACLGYLYFHRVSLKLLNPLRIDENAVYTPPLDAINVQSCL